MDVKETTENMTAKEYLDAMDSVIADQLINPNSIYYGREGHKRFARECGVALNDFCEKDRKEILSSSYGRLYVKHCNLKPILDAKQWISIMRSQIKEEKGWTIVYIPWEDLKGRERVIGRFKTCKEKDDFLREIYSVNSGFTDEELSMVVVVGDYNYMPKL